MGYLKKIVPPMELCKKIPNGKFNESGLFWKPFEDRAGGSVLIRIDAKFNVKRNNSLIPAPTLEEIMNDLPDDVNVRMKLGKNGRRYFQVSWYSEAKWTTNPAAQALRLWLNMESENDRFRR